MGRYFDMLKNEKTPTDSTAKTALSTFGSYGSDHSTHISDFSLPPTKYGKEYEALWTKAWTIADYVDDGDDPLEQRLLMIPEIEKLKARMEEIERTYRKGLI